MQTSNETLMFSPQFCQPSTCLCSRRQIVLMDDGLLYETAAKDTLVVTGHHFVSENCLLGTFGARLKNH